LLNRLLGASYEMLARLGLIKGAKIRHMMAFLRYGSARKLFNLLLVEAQRMLRTERFSGYPYTLYFDPINHCNLQCPGCPTGRGEQIRPGQRWRASFEDFERVVDEFSPYLYLLHLYLWGEPLLHKEIFRFIRHAHDRGIGTNLSSNLNLLDREKADALVLSGLDHLVVSLSGLSQDVYSRYHVGGEMEKVMQNLQILADAKLRHASETPFVELQFILFDYNEEDARLAKERTQEFAADHVLVREAWSEDSELDREDHAEGVLARWGGGDVCRQLYTTLIVHPDGGVGPCCSSTYLRDDFGSLETDSYVDIRNNERFRAARSIFRTGRIDAAAADTLCANCRVAKEYVRARERRRGAASD
jgi:MoaA/NifB/PqqE/SkfB family radical SAM enzyme